MQIAQTTFYALTNYQRDRILNHKQMLWEAYQTATDLIMRASEFLIPTNEQLEMLIEKMKDLPRYKGFIERGVVIEKITVELNYMTLMGVKVEET